MNLTNIVIIDPIYEYYMTQDMYHADAASVKTHINFTQYQCVYVIAIRVDYLCQSPPTVYI